RFVLTLFIVAGFGQSWGQTVPVTGRIADPSEEPLAGATVRLRLPGGEDVRTDVTNARGRFVLRDIRQGAYDLEISFLGYQTQILNIRVGTGPLDLGVVKLEESSVLLESVEVREQAPTATQKEDTVQFNASAFKVMKDASAEDLITKMPSVQTEGGQVKVQGENVGKVLVDGKPFFGNDPSAALKNLPAEVVDKIQIFDQASEQTQFSGIQDGNTVKTINIVTRTDMRAGQFGKVYAGYGSDARYQSGGNINIFDGDRRISLIGMSNNINVQNFASEDILGVLGQSGRGGPSMPGRPSFRGNGGASDFLVNARGGITRTTAFGLNYSEDWGTKTEVSGSYFFNTGDNEAENDWVRQFLSVEGQGDVTTSRSATSNRNNNHRATMRIDHRIDSMNSLLFRPRFTFQSNNGEELSTSETRQVDNLLNQGQARFGSRLETWSGEADLMWRHRFAKPRRTLSVNLVAGYAPKSGNNALQSENAFWIPEPATDTIRQQATLETGNWNGSGHWEYTEPLTPNSQLLASYRFSIQQEESDRLTMDYNETEGLYNLPNDLLSNRFSNDYFTHNGGLGWNYGSDRTFNITARVNYQSASLVNDQILPQQQEFSSTFRNILPFASLRWSPDRFRSIRLFFRSNTRLPGIDQLQNVLNNQNPLQWTLGNPDLRQSASQSLFLRYQYT
ncbi:MAG: TonB-dependent receptor, partial [Saprospiraceae bacterium]|nr:TonB-dependent receptor [Saprospiraceae bacterium]